MIPWIIFERFRTEHPGDATLFIAPSDLLDDDMFSILSVSIDERCLRGYQGDGSESENDAHNQ